MDFISENILIQALQQYAGSFIVVSHNRHFVTQIANKIWYIEDKQIKEYPGTFEEYEYWRKKNEANGLTEKIEPPKPVKKIQEVAPSTQPTNDSILKSLEKELKKVEDQLAKLEAQKSGFDMEMTKPEIFGDFEKLKKVQFDQKKTEKELKEVTTKWEALAVEIDSLA